MTTSDEAKAITLLTERLVTRFPWIAREVVEAVVATAHSELSDARIREYLPLLVEHDAVKMLRTMPLPVHG
jgi:hypothetical protein